jgi:hypothetical protein
VSPKVQGSLSEHKKPLVIGVLLQPLACSVHVATKHVGALPHPRAAPLSHLPVTQISPVVQYRPSSHLVPSASAIALHVAVTPSGVHWPTWQVSADAEQSKRATALQVPVLLHALDVVHGSPSSQVCPAETANLQVPADASQVSNVQLLPSSHIASTLQPHNASQVPPAQLP